MSIQFNQDEKDELVDRLHKANQKIQALNTDQPDPLSFILDELFLLLDHNGQLLFENDKFKPHQAIPIAFFGLQQFFEASFGPSKENLFLQNEFLRFCQLIIKILNRHQISFQAVSKPFEALVTFLLQDNLPYLPERLKALSYLLFENGKILSDQVNTTFIAVFLKHIRSSGREIQRFACNCLGNLVIKSGLKTRAPLTLKESYTILFETLQRCSEKLKRDPSFAKVFASVARCFQLIVTESKLLAEPDFSHVLGILKGTLGHGLGLLPTPEATPKQEESYSDSDSECEFLDRNSSWKVRFHSVTCLASLARANPKLFFSCVDQFLLPTAQEHSSLFTLFKNEVSLKVKIAIVNAISTLLEISKSYLLTAQTPTKTSNFVSLAQKLAILLEGIHEQLITLTNAETQDVLRIPLLKTVQVLAQCSPYDRLRSNLAFNTFIQLIRPILFKKTISNQETAAALSTLTSIFTSRVEKKQFESILIDQESGILFRLIQIASAESPKNDPQVCTEALRTVSSIARKNSQMIYAQWHLVWPLVLQALARKVEVEMIATLSLIEELLKTPQNQIWEELILNAKVLYLLEHSSAQVRASVCSCLCLLPEDVHQELNEKQSKKLFASLLRIGSRDPVPLAKAAACRTLGVLVSKVDVGPSLCVDMIKTISKTLNDSKNTLVRLKASWALANITDALYSHPTWLSQIPLPTLFWIYRSALKACSDNDKISCNGIRALGLFSRLLNPTILKENGSIISELSRNFLQCSQGSSAKAQWNSAYAIGNLFANVFVQTTLEKSSPLWANDLFDLLLKNIQEGINWKVKINSVNALMSLSSRPHYGLAFFPLLQSLIDKLQSVTNFEYSELEYKDTLNRQLKLCICHFLQLMTDSEREKMFCQNLGMTGRLLDELFTEYQILHSGQNESVLPTDLTTPEDLNRSFHQDEEEETGAPAISSEQSLVGVRKGLLLLLNLLTHHQLHPQTKTPINDIIKTLNLDDLI